MSFVLLSGLLLILLRYVLKGKPMETRKLSLDEIFSYIESQSTLVRAAPAHYRCTMAEWLMIKHNLHQRENGRHVGTSSQATPQAGVKQLPPPRAFEASPVQDQVPGEVPASGGEESRSSSADSAGEEEEVIFLGILSDPDEISFTGAEAVTRLPPVG